MSNVMEQIYLDKLVINIGVGQTEDKLQAAKALLKKLTGREAISIPSKKREPELKLRKGQIIATAVTLRKKEAFEMLKRALEANDNIIGKNAVAKNSINFGIKEYIYISGVKYDPAIGMLGMNINGAFARKGRRVEKRKRAASKVGEKHKNIKKEEILEYLQSKFGAKMISEGE